MNHMINDKSFESVMYLIYIVPFNESAPHWFPFPGSKFDARPCLHTTIYTTISQVLSKLGEGTFQYVNAKLTSPLT